MASGYHIITKVDCLTLLFLFFTSCEIQNGKKLETSGRWRKGAFLATPAFLPLLKEALGKFQLTNARSCNNNNNRAFTLC